MLRKIADVHLENNPLICDRCHMGALIQIAKSVSGLFACTLFRSTIAKVPNMFIHVSDIVVLHFISFIRFLSAHSQLRWRSHPVCFLPEPLRGVPISDLRISSLEQCTPTESLHDEGLDAASTSHNFLTRGTQHATYRLAHFVV